MSISRCIANFKPAQCRGPTKFGTRILMETIDAFVRAERIVP